MLNKKGFSLSEIAIVLSIMGVIAVIVLSVIPNLNRAAVDKSYAVELDSAAEKIIQWVKDSPEGLFPAPKFNKDYPYLDFDKEKTGNPILKDKFGNYIGYLPAQTLTLDKVCSDSHKNTLSVKYCLTELCRAEDEYYVRDNIGLIIFTNQLEFIKNMRYSPSLSAGNYKKESITVVAYAPAIQSRKSDTFLKNYEMIVYTLPELKEAFDCATLYRKQNNVLSFSPIYRGISYQKNINLEVGKNISYCVTAENASYLTIKVDGSILSFSSQCSETKGKWHKASKGLTVNANVAGTPATKYQEFTIYQKMITGSTNETIIPYKAIINIE